MTTTLAQSMHEAWDWKFRSALWLMDRSKTPQALLKPEAYEQAVADAYRARAEMARWRA